MTWANAEYTHMAFIIRMGRHLTRCGGRLQLASDSAGVSAVLGSAAATKRVLIADDDHDASFSSPGCERSLTLLFLLGRCRSRSSANVCHEKRRVSRVGWCNINWVGI